MIDYLRLENQVCFPIYALSRQITALYRPYLDKLGLTYPQYLVMMVLWEHKSKTVKELGEILLLDSGTLTPLLKRMETSGFISTSRIRFRSFPGRNDIDQHCSCFKSSPVLRYPEIVAQQKARLFPSFQRRNEAFCFRLVLPGVRNRVVFCWGSKLHGMVDYERSKNARSLYFAYCRSRCVAFYGNHPSGNCPAV